MSYLQRLHACHNADLTQYMPFLIENTVYGYVTPAFAAHLSRWPEVFINAKTYVALNPNLNNYALRTEAVAEIIAILHSESVIDSWVGERFPVTLAFDAPAQFEIERAATRFFGFKSFGVHVNGLVQKPDGIYVWIGIRALHKTHWPGKLDQLVAGGQPVGLGLLENVIKESQEEAKIPPKLAEQARAIGSLSYQCSEWRGLENLTLFTYDLWLPESFTPQNEDGEVERFKLISLEELAHLTEHTEQFKDNCNLVNIDLLLRQGILTKQHADYNAVCKCLYHGQRA